LFRITLEIVIIFEIDCTDNKMKGRWFIRLTDERVHTLEIDGRNRARQGLEMALAVIEAYFRLKKRRQWICPRTRMQ